MRLVPNLPKEGFPKLEHVKFYVGAMQKPLFDILDMDKFKQLPVDIIEDIVPDTRHITFTRHLKSNYNEYRDAIKTNPDYLEFITTQDINKKLELKQVLLKDFFAKVGTDYSTGLSKQGHEDGEKLSILYAQLIKQNPELFPDLIYVSPYVRTRRTTYYQLRKVEGFDLDFDKLINEDNLEDLILGSFKGKEVAIKIDERIRERDHGSNVAPYFIRNFINSDESYDLMSPMDIEKIHFFCSPIGGESQCQTTARVKEFLEKNFEEDKFKNIQVSSHHLAILSGLLSIFRGTFATFHKLNELWQPANGSFTMISQIPETKAGKKNKFRVSGYNLSLEE